MANKVTVIWTALPNGFVHGSNSRLKLSLIATLRLTADQNPTPPNLTLADFSLGNWTETVSHFSFALKFGAAEQPATVIKQFEPEMWNALFGDQQSIKVTPYKLPVTDDNALSKAEMLTYPAKKMSDTVEQTYMELAHRKTRLRTNQAAARAIVVSAETQMKRLTNAINVFMPPDPSEKDRKAVLDALADLDRAIESASDKRAKALAYRDVYLGRMTRNNGQDLLPEVVKSIHEKISDKTDIPRPGQEQGGPIFLRVQPASQPASQGALNTKTSTDFVNFHSPGVASEHSAAHIPPPPTFDFHEMLTMLANYPAVMRKLGLVVDVEVDANIPTDSNVRVS